MAYVFASASASASRIPSNGVIYVDEQGNKFLWAGGTRTWRNNNPGNMINTEISKSYGSIGTAGGFAVFPDVASGRAAVVVHPKYGEPYLRSFADASSGNNFSNLVVS